MTVHRSRPGERDSRAPGFQADGLILGNHGLIVAADDCDAVRNLLEDVERRLSCPVRAAQAADLDALAQTVPEGFRIALDPEVHALATDSFSMRVAVLGTLYPDPCVYLGAAVALVKGGQSAGDAVRDFLRVHGLLPRVLLVAGKGVLVAGDLNRAGREVLISVKRVIERLDTGVPIRALDAAEVSNLVNWEAEKYRIALAGQYEDQCR